MVPLREEDLAGAASRTRRRERDLPAVRRGHRQAVEAVGVGHAHRLLRAGRIHHEHLEVLEAELVRGKQDVLARGVHVGRPAHRLEVGDLLLVGAVEVHRPDVGDEALLVEAPPQDLLAVGREERAAVVAGRLGQAALAAAIGLHDVDLGEPRRVGGELFLFGGAQRVIVGGARRAEDDPLAVGRIAAFGVVAAHVRQPLQRLRLLLIRVDLHLRVVVPRVAPFLARGAERDLVVLLLLRGGIVVRRGEHDLVAARTEEAAGGLAHAGRDARRLAGGQVHHVLLIERIARFAFALQHEACAIGRPVAFAGTLAVHGETADARQERTFLVRRFLGQHGSPGDERGEQQSGCTHRRPFYRGGGRLCRAYFGGGAARSRRIVVFIGSSRKVSNSSV